MYDDDRVEMIWGFFVKFLLIAAAIIIGIGFFKIVEIYYSIQPE